MASAITRNVRDRLADRADPNDNDHIFH